MKRLITGFFMAWGNFFVIPCPHKVWDDSCRNIMLGWLPVFGSIMGALWFGAYALVLKCGLPAQITALILAVFPFLLSGCIHLDGFMDCSDAILSRRPLEDRQRILKDSHVGAFAVISLGVLLLTCYASMSAFSSAIVSCDTGALVSGSAALAVDSGKQALAMGATFIVIPAASRFVAAIDVLSKKPISHSQYNGTVKQGGHAAAVTITAVATLLTLGAAMLAAGAFGAGSGGAAAGIFAVSDLQLICCKVFIIELIVCFIAGAYARRQLGGMSGDIAGYTVTIGETSAMLTLALLI